MRKQLAGNSPGRETIMMMMTARSGPLAGRALENVPLNSETHLTHLAWEYELNLM